ncbi:chemotaxis protein [Campylobacter concisus]|uniref:Chemotaxis protein n=1 Tax=Campylobacter concisus TaxID=199 RepID=A0A1X0U0R5_9BACT|nr:chemotaxis protein [Campylobacter concisus]
MKFIKILMLVLLLLTACTAANYANAFEKVGILEDGVYRFSKNGLGANKNLLVKVISVQNAEIPHKKIISMLNIPKKSKINDFKTNDTGVIVWPFYEFEGKFITTIIVENIKKEDSDQKLLKMLELKHPFYSTLLARRKVAKDAIDVKYVLNFKEARLVKSFKNRP